ncbi:uncharacterized protein ACHE_41291A [Aspergillus chevalieri]|uniref:SUMO-targeted ubiquitin ligase complex subunit slx8 n=1 Tax=Aspergillus chevalieri TaxID=182096 RepID=A0A7R7ZPX7_ASPCH|nr:SUMO-targeted ubiquitin ligase complex subunit slx8 [Aspergillus chevalieri]BCR88727.1 SUMO-targeted ubiquitin ligase complex subunit slx8 [Aspergillus chevalieri]
MDLGHYTIPPSSSISSPASQPPLPHSRSTRLPSSSPPSASPNSPSGSEGREKKRRRTIRGENSETPEFIDSEEEQPVESIDLTEVDKPSALDKVLAKQREDAVKAQHDGESEKGRSLLTAYKCPVCMDTPEDATTTVCGHLFCHRCIIDTLKFSEEQRADSATKGPRGTCPVCRKPLARKDEAGPKRSLVPLKLQLTKRSRTSIPADV